MTEDIRPERYDLRALRRIIAERLREAQALREKYAGEHHTDESE